MWCKDCLEKKMKIIEENKNKEKPKKIKKIKKDNGIKHF